MVAAAYAKDILYQIPPIKVEVEQKIIKTDVYNMHHQQRQDRIDSWLSPLDPLINYNKAFPLQTLQQCEENTGVWLLKQTAFENWKSQQNSLWLRGIPGCGKTILTSTVIEDYNKKHLGTLFSTHEEGRHQPSCESLCKVFYQMIESTKDVWVVLDALDECRTQLLNSKQRNVHLLVTSRPEQDIHMELKYLAQNNDNIVLIQSEFIERDINTYIHAKDNIEAQLMQKANGMFGWVAYLRTLEHVLESLPKDLDEIYERIIESIPHKVKQTTTRILQFLTYSERPLSIAEAADAIAVDLEAEPYFESRYRMPEPEEILLYCSSLVIRIPGFGHSDEKSNKQAELQLVHFTVKEYLISNRLTIIISQDLQETSARASIAKGLRLDKIRADFPLAEYSAKFWLKHAAAQKEECGLPDWIKRLFYNQKTAYHICYNLYRPDEPPWEESHRDKPASALYYAVCGNLWKFIPVLLNNNRTDVNAQGGFYGNALQAASFFGHEQTVKLLVDKGADINAQGGCYSNALQTASARGHEVCAARLPMGSDNPMIDGKD
ncbi:hypothetical protein GQ43DRAFT_457754 [Delitschia confertaspora ATCC 74209]|uniref:Ankyrin repeat protein n=1 Tax=Delitschia confertaspora ATCC 74209 TaxID=1513339 RepID=A0A9P4MQ36_9PLEO|nr:hypothetical protein GQ43DRAFT_457754 [Delitschia confertaspora ATCC 74209]